MATTARTDRTTVRTSESPRLRPIARVRDIWGYREILSNLIRKDLKVKYTQSVLGVVWSMLNPVLYLAVFSFVVLVLKGNIPSFPVYLLAGVIPWTMFSGSLNLSVKAVVDNTSLVKKVYFPKEILPLSSVGASLVDFGLQTAVLIVFMLIIGYPFLGPNLLLLPFAVVALIVFTVALSLLVAALNVRYRDTQHLLANALLVWFWLTPIVYPIAKVQEAAKDAAWLFKGYLVLNPLAAIISGFQRALYAQVTPIGVDGKPTSILLNTSLTELAVILTAVTAVSLVILLLCWRSFFHRAGDFAEEL